MTRPARVAARSRRSAGRPRTTSAPPRGDRDRHRADGIGGVADEQVVGEHVGVACGRPLRLGEVGAQALALDVDVGQDAREPLRQPPGAAPGERHRGGHERHAHEERVERDADRERERDALDDAGALGHEGEEDEEHDERGRRDDAGGVLEAVHDRRCADPGS